MHEAGRLPFRVREGARPGAFVCNATPTLSEM